MRVTPDRRQCARVCADPDEGAGDTRGRRSGTRRLQIPQADQVIGRGGESELPIDEWDAAMPELAQTTDGLIQPKTFLALLSGWAHGREGASPMMVLYRKNRVLHPDLTMRTT